MCIKRSVRFAGGVLFFALSNATVNRAASRWGVLIVRSLEFGKDGDHASGHPEFKLFTIPVAGPTSNGPRHYEGGLVLFLTMTVREAVNLLIV
jgi:hypothetical protein